MKKLLVLFALVLGFSSVNAQKFKGLDKSPMDAVSFPMSYKNSDKIVKIIYSRPQLNGRSLKELAKPGKVWRTGANEAAEITFYEDVVFGGEKVKAGTYSLFTIPNKDSWTVVLSTDLNVWGSYFYKEANDVLRFDAKVSKTNDVVEAFSDRKSVV